MKKRIESVLVANRGVPAVRIMHTCRDHRIKTIAVYSEPDRLAHHVYMADHAEFIGEGPPMESYLNIERIIEVAKRNKVDAIHPGWGFLAENANFARRVIEEGIIWIGPPPDLIELLGDKIEAKKIAIRSKTPVIPGVDNITSVKQVADWMKADNVKFPIMIKAAAGGGGKGMVKVDSAAEVEAGMQKARSEASKAFGDDVLMAEKYIERGRHLEVQIVGDMHGNITHLFERECTLQRRHQKIIEEAPAPTLEYHTRQELCSSAIRLMRELGYYSAGTVEFIYDCPTNEFYFLEVNTRLQVEHGITELATGVDIVGLMIEIASGRKLPFKQEDITPNRCALEVRINAEDPRTFNPSFGTITRLLEPQGPAVRVASGVYEGAQIPPYYDSLAMLLMTSGKDRGDAIRVMDRSLDRNLRIEGIKNNAPLLLSIIRHPAFKKGDFSTRFIEKHIGELVKSIPQGNTEDDVLKVANFVAKVSALGPRDWM